jgi:hypothetical protein
MIDNFGDFMMTGHEIVNIEFYSVMTTRPSHPHPKFYNSDER